MARLGDEALTRIVFPPGRVLYATHADALEQQRSNHLPLWSDAGYLNIRAAAT